MLALFGWVTPHLRWLRLSGSTHGHRGVLASFCRVAQHSHWLHFAELPITCIGFVWSGCLSPALASFGRVALASFCRGCKLSKIGAWGRWDRPSQQGVPRLSQYRGGAAALAVIFSALPKFSAWRVQLKDKQP